MKRIQLTSMVLLLVFNSASVGKSSGSDADDPDGR